MASIVRRVPKDWQHPKYEDGRYIPLFDGMVFYKRITHWDEGAQKWNEGFQTDFEGGWIPLTENNKNKTYSSWAGERPDPIDYTPLWRGDECTHFMLYEDISEGTPISPLFSTIEELHQWVENNRH